MITPPMMVEKIETKECIFVSWFSRHACKLNTGVWVRRQDPNTVIRGHGLDVLQKQKEWIIDNVKTYSEYAYLEDIVPGISTLQPTNKLKILNSIEAFIAQYTCEDYFIVVHDWWFGSLLDGDFGESYYWNICITPEDGYVNFLSRGKNCLYTYYDTIADKEERKKYNEEHILAKVDSGFNIRDWVPLKPYDTGEERHYKEFSKFYRFIRHVDAKKTFPGKSLY